VSRELFQARSEQDVLRLLREQPFGWLICGHGETFRASAIPFRPRLGPTGRLVGLWGHLARSNPQVELLQRDPRAEILILGTNGYISPSWMSDRTQAPTWNYASVQFLTNISFIENDSGLEQVLRDLVGAMEIGRPNAWSIEDMGARYARLAQRIVAFEANIAEMRPKFKLGQDERRDVFSDIMRGLEASEADELRAWMADFAQR
jgi:predicted FMN-binding regulatory protein PaiB